MAADGADNAEGAGTSTGGRGSAEACREDPMVPLRWAQHRGWRWDTPSSVSLTPLPALPHTALVGIFGMDGVIPNTPG